MTLEPQALQPRNRPCQSGCVRWVPWLSCEEQPCGMITVNVWKSTTINTTKQAFYSGGMKQTVRAETMADKDTGCVQMSTSLRMSKQRCNTTQNCKVAQVYLTWQTLIHILPFSIVAPDRQQRTDTPIFVFFTRTKFREHFTTAPHVERKGGAHICIAKIKSKMCYCTKPDPKRLSEKTVQFNSLFIILCSPLMFSNNIKH